MGEHEENRTDQPTQEPEQVPRSPMGGPRGCVPAVDDHLQRGSSRPLQRPLRWRGRPTTRVHGWPARLHTRPTGPGDPPTADDPPLPGQDGGGWRGDDTPEFSRAADRRPSRPDRPVRWSRITPLLALGLVTLGLAACGNSSSSSTTTTNAITTTTGNSGSTTSTSASATTTSTAAGITECRTSSLALSLGPPNGTAGATHYGPHHAEHRNVPVHDVRIPGRFVPQFERQSDR